MGRILKRRVAALALTVGLVGGGAIAAVAATGGGSHSGGSAVRGAQFLKTAADYLGLSRGQLQSKLRAGQTLAEIATAEGKPAAPLMQALGQSASSQVEQRLRATAARVGNGKHHGHRLGHSLRAAAAKYLGLTPSALAQQLRSGATLAQIADRTPGRSSAGLIEALIQTRQQMTAENGSAKQGGNAGSSAQVAKIRQRITAFVNKSHIARPKTSGTRPGAGHAGHRGSHTKKHG